MDLITLAHTLIDAIQPSQRIPSTSFRHLPTPPPGRQGFRLSLILTFLLHGMLGAARQGPASGAAELWLIL